MPLKAANVFSRKKSLEVLSRSAWRIFRGVSREEWKRVVRVALNRLDSSWMVECFGK